MKLVSDNGEVSEAFVNGYMFDDSVLEDVWFKIIVENNKLKVVGPKDSSAKYFEKLNKELYLNLIQKGIKSVEFFKDSSLSEDVWVEE